ncbi:MULTISPECIES: SLOG family protein [Enterococcus]|uniref:SLOG family protein n=1 Tax=Enterococcus TaxID=1350 RepID=UPI00065E5D89|nr:MULTISPECIES: DUF1273 domain-containing protein [Enterococcus]KAF1301191.1 hypothetical protein BAU16_10660 [Enterococcus sp. JM9B]
METIKTMLLTGYRSYELGIFQEKDPKIAIIKKSIKNVLLRYLDEGLEWILIGGNLGTEFWGAEVVFSLKKEYPSLKLGLIFPFEGFGEQWNEKNREKLFELRSKADYVNATSHEGYKNPSQLRNHTRFFLEHSGGVIMVYDEEFPGKTQYFLKEAMEFSQNNPYLIDKITMDDLQNVINE